jgi:hypothetical protein
MLEAWASTPEAPPPISSFDNVCYELFLTFGFPLERNRSESGRAQLKADLEALAEDLEEGPLNLETSPEEHESNKRLVQRGLRFFGPGGPFYELDNWPLIH